MAVPILKNRDARRLFLDRHGLCDPVEGPATGDNLCALIERLGFVQVDSINTLERAHHMILHARCKSYRPRNLAPLLEQDRTLFEHWTHDAAIIPTSFYPYWRLRFQRDAASLSKRWKSGRRAGFDQKIKPVLRQVNENGPLCSQDVGTDEEKGAGGWWDWHPSKTALEYLWHAGVLAVCHRRGFRKFYDLTERVVPDAARAHVPSAQQTIDWACAGAIDRLGFATSGEIAAFWAKVTAGEARQWCAAQLRKGLLEEIDVQSADGTLRRCFARPQVIANANKTRPAPSITRILSPFDPVLRDRDRTERLFGFHYRIEVFVPKTKRKYGYYVFPVLDAENLIGRIDMKANRGKSILNVTGFWPENAVHMSKGRQQRLQRAIRRTAKFANLESIEYSNGWFKT